MRRSILLLFSATCLACSAMVVFAYTSNPPLEETGAPGEGLCSDCHGTYPVNQSGMIEILDAPSLYRQGSTYRLRIRITTDNTSGDANRKWGFELTAINSSNGEGAGTFANVSGQLTGTATGGSSNPTRTYVRQTDGRQGSASPVEWMVDWTAPPAPGNIPVVFYAAGVAGNGGGASGDWVYTASVSAADTTTATLSSSWGDVKARYRR